jgi:erythromycin esterase-like protein
MISGGVDSWNIRDLHMMDTLENLLQFHGPDSKVIVWAHNTHIGDYHATDMLENGYLNLGGLARERFGVENVFLLGMSTYQGEVTAGSSWGGIEKRQKLPKAKDGTYEDFHQASVNMNAKQFLTEFKQLDKSAFLNGKLEHRAIGMVYNPNHESHSNYIPTQMAKRYDGIIFIDQTSALKSLPTIFAVDEFPDSWPQGQ